MRDTIINANFSTLDWNLYWIVHQLHIHIIKAKESNILRFGMFWKLSLILGSAFSHPAPLSALHFPPALSQSDCSLCTTIMMEIKIKINLSILISRLVQNFCGKFKWNFYFYIKLWIGNILISLGVWKS